MKLKITQEWLESFGNEAEEPTGHATNAERAELKKRGKSAVKELPPFETRSIIGKKAKPIRLTGKEGVHHAFNIISRLLVKDRIQDFAQKVLNPILRDEDVTFVPILNGALHFYDELSSFIDEGSSEELMGLPARSYGIERGSGEVFVAESMIVPRKVQDHTVIVLDAIFDLGIYLDEVIRLIERYEPKQLITVFLLRKQNAQLTSVCSSYSLFEIHPDSWPFGFGMDLDEKYRGLPHVCDANLDLYESDGTPRYNNMSKSSKASSERMLHG